MPFGDEVTLSTHRWVAPPGWPVPPAGWSPPPGWKPDQSWPLPPPGWQWWQPIEEPVTQVAPEETAAADAASLRTELAVVFGVVWLPWVIDGVVGLMEGVAKSTTSALPVAVKGHQVLSATALSLALGANLLGVVLIWYVLRQRGESFATIGWYRRVTWRDAAAALALLAAIFAITGAVGSLLAALGLPNYQYGSSPHLPSYFLIPGWIGALAAGVSEETLVAGYLLHRLDQLGVPKRRAILISAAARASYHIYYGFGAFIMFTVGLLFAWRWYRSRRLWRLVGAHALWDGIGFTAVVLSS